MKKVMLICSILIISLFSFNNCYADDGDDWSSRIYNAQTINQSKLTKAGSTVAWYFTWAGIGISVVMLMIKGIRYITSSPEGSAKIKEELLPWAIGLVLLLTMNVILNFIIKFAQDNVNTLTI